jgi:HEPN domain-containing protein
MKPYESWLIKAYHDLISAKKLTYDQEPVLDTAIYHTQQCAEKALKGYLSYQQQPPQKSHNLRFLVERCQEIDETFAAIIDDAEELSPFATAYRYPDMIMEPEAQEVAVATKQAEKIFDFVRQKVPLSDEATAKLTRPKLSDE